MARQLDIILMVLDTQRVDRLSCYGYPSEITPNIDSLAADATLFQQAISAAQWTVPSHASMFTGLYPTQHTVHQMNSILPAVLQTLAERLAMGGYYTAGFSHNPLVGTVDNGFRRGFNEFTNYRHLGAGLLAYQFSKHQRQGQALARLKGRARFVLAELLGYSQSSPLHHLSPIAWPLWSTARGLTTGSKVDNIRDSLASAASLLIDRRGTDRNQPVFAFINLMGVHVPYEPPGWALRQYISKKFGSASAPTILRQANNWQVDVRNWLGLEDFDEEKKAFLNACYDAEVASQDAEVGRFVDVLRKSGAFNNTLFIIVADHGDHLGDKERINHAFGVYNALTRVPLLIRDPSERLPKGRVVDNFVSTRRIFHTILVSAGTANDEVAKLSLDQQNELEDKTVMTEGHPLDWAISRLERSRPGLALQYGYDRPVRALFTDHQKLIVSGEKLELYAQRTDPHEERNLASEHSEEAAKRVQLLNDAAQRIRPVTEDLQVNEIDQAVIEHLRDLGYIE